jgi:hypothetical protein
LLAFIPTLVFAGLDATSLNSKLKMGGEYRANEVGSVARTINERLQDGPVSIVDFGATITPGAYAANNAAFALAFATGRRVLIPAGTWEISSNVSIPTKSQVVAEGEFLSIIKCRNDVNSAAGLSMTGHTSIVGALGIVGVNKTGTGLRLGAPDPLVFTGHINAEKLRITGFNKALDIGNVFNVHVGDLYTDGNIVGVELSPQSNGGDNGYANVINIENWYSYLNHNYDLHINPAIRVSSLHLGTVTLDPGATITKAYLHGCSPCEIDNLYIEGGASVPAVSIDLSVLRIASLYLNGTGGITASNTQSTIELEQVRTATSTDVINAGYALHTLRITDASFPSTGNTITNAIKYFSNATINGTHYTNVVPSGFTVGDSNGMLGAKAYKKSVTATIDAGSTVALIVDHYEAGIFSGEVTATANLSNIYKLGLILTVTPASTGSQDYFNVLATNTTGIPITLVGATLNVLITRMENATVIQK